MLHSDGTHQLLQIDGDGGKSFSICSDSLDLDSWQHAIETRIAYLRFLKSTRNRTVPPDPAILSFQNRDRLTEFSFNGVTLAPEGIVCITPCLAHHPNLREISFENSGINDSQLETLCRGISSNQNLRKLNLAANKFSSKGALTLTGALTTTGGAEARRALVNLNISRNALTSVGVASLANVLSSDQLPHLVEFEAAEVLAKDDGLKAVVAALDKRATLQRPMKLLDLSRNEIGNVHLSKLIAVVQRLEIQTLKMASNVLSDDVVTSIVPTLPLMSNISLLDLSGNGFSRAVGVRMVLSASVECERLTSLKVAELALEKDGLQTLRLIRASKIFK
jgi:Ran GTPase-activating protein (RanGAP) involved in mRNA processing and transport